MARYTRTASSGKAPSETGWKSMGPDQPRTCRRCGEKVLVSSSTRSAWFQTSEPKWSAHADCEINARRITG